MWPWREDDGGKIGAALHQGVSRLYFGRHHIEDFVFMGIYSIYLQRRPLEDRFFLFCFYMTTLASLDLCNSLQCVCVCVLTRLPRTPRCCSTRAADAILF